MPSYKTHSIHGECLYSLLDRRIPLDLESFKLFCMGPDAMLFTDYHTFSYQHANKTRDFFLNLKHKIKENHLEYDGEAMAFLYGQVDHFVLDATFHPYIYYLTSNLPNTVKINPHCLIEMWMDDYVMNINNIPNKKYYQNNKIRNKKLKEIIDEVYLDTYGLKKQSKKYDRGYLYMSLFDSMIRDDKSGFASWIMKNFHIGDITFKKEYNRVVSFLNKDRSTWFDPETEEKREESFDDLWLESLENSYQVIQDINSYLYEGKELKSPFLLEDISYNTGLSCSKGQSLQYVKRY